ncbi:hypothetical protein ACFL6Y_00755 [Elusimicrobiota bacterium]
MANLPSKLPRNNQKLEIIFKNAAVPEIAAFTGEYFVDMLTIMPSVRIFNHTKKLYMQNSKLFGYNVVFGIKWGYFSIEEGVCEELGSAKTAVIDYSSRGNTFLTNKIIDYVRCVEDGNLYLGRFNYRVCGKPRFAGYFSLERRK